jgi:hypothetical protein
LVLAINRVGEATNILLLLAFDSFILTVFTSGQGILPDWQAMHTANRNKAAPIFI